MSKIEVNQISSQCGSTLTIGQSGDSIQLACGATQTGFGRTGTVDWDTTAKTASFTAVSGTGYFVNTTSGAITVTMPATPSAGDIVGIKDYAGTFGTNNVTVARNGSLIDGTTTDPILSTNQLSVFFVYVDGTQGWKATQSDAGDYGALFVTATGGTVTCCGDYKIHTFTGPGTFCVSCAGNACGSNTVEYLVVAGGGGGSAACISGAGGGGGFRFVAPSLAPLCYPAKPLAAPANLPVTAQGYPIQIGSGGAGSTAPGSPPGTAPQGTSGGNSVFSTITSTGGGGGGGSLPGCAPSAIGLPGGSGGGGAYNGAGGSGNTPPVSPPQGNDGGTPSPTPTGSPGYGASGGGGAITAGSSGTPTSGGAGGTGAGIPNAFGTSGESCGANYYFSGGGAGANETPTGATGGLGGGGDGGFGGGVAPSANRTGCAGTVNTGGGGGGTCGGGPASCFGPGGNGGSGIVIIRYKYQ
jgi:hypothetical protein